jgi:hypothetical protein
VDDIISFCKILDGNIFPTNQHLFILDGHGSHVTLQVVTQAQQLGLKLLTLLAHTSHVLQPFDVSCFKLTFRLIRGEWQLKHKLSC